MKNSKCIFSIIGAVVTVAAAVAAIVVFRKEIADFFKKLTGKSCCACSEFSEEEINDFADI